MSASRRRRPCSIRGSTTFAGDGAPSSHFSRGLERRRGKNARTAQMTGCSDLARCVPFSFSGGQTGSGVALSSQVFVLSPSLCRLRAFFRPRAVDLDHLRVLDLSSERFCTLFLCSALSAALPLRRCSKLFAAISHPLSFASVLARLLPLEPFLTRFAQRRITRFSCRVRSQIDTGFVVCFFPSRSSDPVLCRSDGVALNCPVNAPLRQEKSVPTKSMTRKTSAAPRLSAPGARVPRPACW